jgi:hypothetical protein
VSIVIGGLIGLAVSASKLVRTAIGSLITGCRRCRRSRGSRWPSCCSAHRECDQLRGGARRRSVDRQWRDRRYRQRAAAPAPCGSQHGRRLGGPISGLRRARGDAIGGRWAEAGLGVRMAQPDGRRAVGRHSWHPDSLGTRMQFAREFSDAEGLIATMVVILIIGVLVDTLVFARIERRVLRRRGLGSRRSTTLEASTTSNRPGLPFKLGRCSNGEYVPPPLSPVAAEAMRRARTLERRRRCRAGLESASVPHLVGRHGGGHRGAAVVRGRGPPRRPVGHHWPRWHVHRPPDGGDGTRAGNYHHPVARWVAAHRRAEPRARLRAQPAGAHVRRRVPAGCVRRRRPTPVLHAGALDRPRLRSERHHDGGALRHPSGRRCQPAHHGGDGARPGDGRGDVWRRTRAHPGPGGPGRRTHRGSAGGNDRGGGLLPR